MMKHLAPRIAILVTILLVTATAARAQIWENDVRFRAGLYIPQDLPTDSGLMLGLEVRNLLWEHDGLIYGVHLYDEQRTDRQRFGTGSIDLEADIRLTPFLFGWYHIFPQKIVHYTAGAAIGLYESNSFSGGATSTSQVSDVGDFRFLQDDTYFGFNFFFGADFFPESRWGVGVEARFHLVENDFGGTELGAGGIFRF